MNLTHKLDNAPNQAALSGVIPDSIHKIQQTEKPNQSQDFTNLKLEENENYFTRGEKQPRVREIKALSMVNMKKQRSKSFVKPS